MILKKESTTKFGLEKFSFFRFSFVNSSSFEGLNFFIVGKNFASALMQNAIDIAREHQQASVFLEVLTANTRAKKFYQNFAFTEKLSIDFKTDLYDIGMDLMQLELTSR